jgi:Ni,Fe-hydrogenase III large subunit
MPHRAGGVRRRRVSAPALSRDGHLPALVEVYDNTASLQRTGSRPASLALGEKLARAATSGAEPAIDARPAIRHDTLQFQGRRSRKAAGVSRVSGSASARSGQSFRGDVLAWLRIVDGRIARCHLRDPSWFQWPLLEVAVEGNIVADFPLCNKSFNCSYSGHDL